MIVDNSIKIDDKPVRGRAALDLLRADLEQMILSGELGPGDRLNELSLSSRFGVNRGVLREAIRTLEEAHLVCVVANRGAYVRKLDLGEALDLFDVRAGFARSAGRLAVQRASRDQIRALRSVHSEMGKSAKKGDVARFHSLNLEFHDLLIEAAANERLRRMDRAVRNEMQLYLRNNLRSEMQLRVSHQEHGEIISALLAGDPEHCAQAFEFHVLHGKQRLLEDANRHMSNGRDEPLKTR